MVQLELTIVAALSLGAPALEGPAAGTVRPAPQLLAQTQRTVVLTDPAQRCPMRPPSQFQQTAQYAIWFCQRGSTLQQDYYTAAGYQHSIIVQY